ncbi:hypothetical protein [Comamonas sp. JC664]|uniref:hypothetical protein n=1 Tax=Comamonas sp. JC664 TaxID=2801917 RepID=UPI0036709979
MIAIEQNSMHKAIKIFQELTRDYPGMPEPTTTWPCCMPLMARTAGRAGAGAIDAHQPQLHDGA